MLRGKKIIIFFFLLFSVCSLRSQTLTGTVNAYAPVTGICQSEITVSSPAGFAAGDKVLLIQMRGANVDVTNTAAFGNVTALNSSGKYEFLTVAGIAGSIIYTTTNPQFAYNISGQVQLVKVASYTTNITIGAGGVSGNAWNGSSGGVVVIETTGSLTFAGNINASGLGFRGGLDNNSSWGCVLAGTYDFLYAVGSTSSAPKGEGIATQFLSGVNGEGRGKAANGGGAGNNVNAGGGGGSNGSIAGLGGKEWATCTGPIPANTQGGAGLSLSGNYSNVINRVFMGGGGGAGHAGANVPGGGQGGNGGGIVILKANTINGVGSVINSGTAGSNINGQWAGGGGGGGGVVLMTYTTIAGTINVTTNGGAGGPAYWPNQVGPGGGGGGGVLWISGAMLPGAITYVTTGGVAGTWNNAGIDFWGATNGNAGMAVLTALSMPPQSIILPGFCALLPIEMAAFDAVKNNQQVDLAWKTASEKNCDRFIIERSGDEINWEALGELKGKGTTLIEQSYFFNDKHPLDENNYYRLRQVDIDGKFNFSETKVIRFYNDKIELAVYPNPGNDLIHIDYNFHTTGTEQLFLNDMMGGLIKVIEVKENTHGTINIDCKTILPGIYFLKVGNTTSKIIISR